MAQAQLGAKKSIVALGYFSLKGLNTAVDIMTSPIWSHLIIRIFRISSLNLAGMKFRKISIKENDKIKAQSMLESLGVTGAYVVIHMTPRRSSKAWNAESFAEVVRYIKLKKELTVIFVGDETDDKTYLNKVIDLSKVNVINLSGMTALGELSAIIQKSTFFVGIDSGPSHIAGACKIPSVILFSGVNSPLEWAPLGDNIHVVYPGEGMRLDEIKPEKVCDRIDNILS